MNWVVRKRVILLLFVSVLLGYGAIRLAVHRVGHEALSDAPGEPTTPEELNAWYRDVPEDENAAPLYLKAFAAVGDTGAKEVLLPLVNGKPLPPPDEAFSEVALKVISEHLSRNAETVRLLHDAAARPKSRYPNDYRTKDVPEYFRELRYAARDLALEAALEAEAGHGEAAVQALLAGFAAAASLRDEPTPIAPDVRWSCYIPLLDALQRVLTRAALANTQLVSLASAIDGADTGESVRRSIVGMRCLVAKSFDDPSAHAADFIEPGAPPPGHPAFTKLSWGFYRCSGLADIEHLRFNQLLREWQEVCATPFPARLQAAVALQEEVNAMPSWVSRITRLIMKRPVITARALQEAGHLARLSTARTAIAIEQYRLVKGTPPPRLEDLVPEFLPKRFPDPFTGEALFYQPRPQGYLVYSVGPNLEDNKGARGARFQEGDIVTEVAR